MLKSPLVPIFLIVSVDVLGLTIILPLLPFYAEKFGASPSVVGLLVSTYALCQLIAGPILGRMSDHMGRRPLLLVSQMGTFIGFLILAYANALWIIFLSRVIDGLTAGNLSLAQAYISDVTKPEDRAKSFALIRGSPSGWDFSSALASRVIYRNSATNTRSSRRRRFRPPAYSRPTSCWLQPRRDRRMQPRRESSRCSTGAITLDTFARRNSRRCYGNYFAFTLAFSIFMSGFPLFAERRFAWHGHPFGPKEVGYIYAYLGLLGVILQGGLIGPFVKAFGELTLVRAGFFFGMVGLAVLGFTYPIPLLLVVSAAASSGTGLVRAVLTSLITQKAGRSEQGVVLGLTQSLNSIAQIIAPAIGGLLIDHSLLAGWAVLAAAICGVALLL